jgi:HD-GYP domain-containing protein (c-di-GMP phosphodiesterase class II)
VRLRHEASDGVLGLARLDPARAFQPPDALLLGSLAEQIRLAMNNAELFEDLRVFLMATVKSLVGAIEEKDPYTSGHSERVHLISMLIGRQLGLGAAEMETLRWASILHDVGKIGLPGAILQKPGRLTDEEFAVVREHPDRGYRLLRPIRQLAEAAVCIRAHHEQVDGSGYPRGLRGEAIPRLARIIAVADTFDALTSTRAYRTARTLDYSLEEIRRVRGTQLDTEAVDAFFRLESFLREHQVMIQAPRAEERRQAA